MRRDSLEKQTGNLLRRSLPEGAFAARPGGMARPDATAWAVMALEACRIGDGAKRAARRALEKNQTEKGSVGMTAEHGDALWPTSLAILAWQGSADFHEAQKRAADFLVRTSGTHWKKEVDAHYGHDPGIKGWSWIEGTHSWVEPTAMAAMALAACGYAGHERVQEAMRLLMNRQLSRGGWNYGNTTVYGKELKPFPETTGIALCALAGSVQRKDVETSLAYLGRSVGVLRTPLALGWGVLGLSAWGERPGSSAQWIVECLSRQEKAGDYDTSALSLLLIACRAEGGFLKMFQRT